ncbi:MAG TPA: ABC transporter ATP-binding protein [Methanomassiliicoccales archaeon]|jgi:ABC-2 type transport system ATP-binding protein
MNQANEDNSFLAIDSVTKTYGNFVALKDVSFSIGSGEIFGYIGPNGSGKTTTIKILVGLLTDFEGDVRFKGQSIRNNKMLINKELGYLPQTIGFQEWRTVDHALTTFGRLSGISENELDSRIKTALERVGIPELRHKKINQLSGGTVQKVGMAQAILHQPSVLILDEPMAGLDPTARFEFKKIFQDLRKEGSTIFFSSHILNDVQDLADRIGFLSYGHMGYVGSMSEIKERVKVPKQIEIVLAPGSKEWSAVGTGDGIEVIGNPEPGRYIICLAPEADADQVIDRLIRDVLTKGGRIRKVAPIVPTLEDIYINYLAGVKA